MDIAVRANLCGSCGERPICVDIVVTDQSEWILCGNSIKRPICVDTVVIMMRDQSMRILW